MPRAMPPLRRSALVEIMRQLREEGGQTRRELSSIQPDNLRQALKQGRDRGYLREIVVLTAEGQDMLRRLDDWQYDESLERKLRASQARKRQGV